MRRRCKFELQFTDLAGALAGGVVASDAWPPRLVRVAVDQRDSKKRYAITEPLSLVAGTSSPPQSVTWECSVGPGKAVQLGLLVSAGAAEAAPARSATTSPLHTPRAGIRGRMSSSAASWQQLACTALTLGPLVPGASRESAAPLGSLASQAADALGSGDAGGDLSPRALVSRRTSLQSNSSFSTTAAGNTAGGDAGGSGSDRPSPFLALAMGEEGQTVDSSELEQPHAAPSSLATAFRGLKGPAAQRASVQDDAVTAGSSPDVSRLPTLDVAGLWAVGSTQVTRCTLHWQVAGSGQDLAQEVVVVAQLLQERPSLSNLFGLLSKEGSQPGSSSNLRGMQSGGSASPAAPGRSRLWGSSLTAAASGGTTDQAAGVSGPPTRPVDASSQPDAGPAQQDARRVTFDPVPPTSTAAAAPVSPTKLAEAEAEEEAEEQAKRDFLQLIMSTLSSAASVESEAGLPGAMASTSAAQLAAAASLPRKPSTADLALFAAAAGLPIETVNSAAAATRLAVSTGGHNSRGSSGGSPGSSRGSPARQRHLLPPLPTSAAEHSGPAAVAASIVAAAAAEAATATAEAAVSGPPAAHGPAAVVVGSASIRPGVQTVAAPARSSATADSPTMAAAVPWGAVLSATALADVGPADVSSTSGWEPQALTVATVMAAAAPHSSSTLDGQPDAAAATTAATLLVTTEPGDVCDEGVATATHSADNADAVLAVASGSVAPAPEAAHHAAAAADSGAEQPEASAQQPEGDDASQGATDDEAVVPSVVQLPLESSSPSRQRTQAPSTPLPTAEHADSEPPQPEPVAESMESAPAPLEQTPLGRPPSTLATASPLPQWAEGCDDGGCSSSASSSSASSSTTGVGRSFGGATSADAESPLKRLILRYNQLFEAADNLKASLQQERAARSSDQDAQPQPLLTDQAGPSGALQGPPAQATDSSNDNVPQSAAVDTAPVAPAAAPTEDSGCLSSQPELALPAPTPAASAPASAAEPGAPPASAGAAHSNGPQQPVAVPEIQPADDGMPPGLVNGAPQQLFDLHRTHSRLAAVLDSASSSKSPAGSRSASSSLLTVPGVLAASSAAAGSVVLAAGSAAAAVLPAGVGLAVFTAGQVSGVVSSAVSAGMSAALYMPVAAARASMQLAGGAASSAAASLASSSSNSSAAKHPEARGSWGTLLFSPFTREASAPPPSPAPAVERKPSGSSSSGSRTLATGVDQHSTTSNAAAVPPRSQDVLPARTRSGTWTPAAGKGLVSCARAYVALWLWLFTLLASAPLNLVLGAFRFVTARQTPSSAPAASATIAGSASQPQERQQEHEEAATPFETARPEQDDSDVVELESADSRPDSTTLSTSGSSGLLSGGFMRRRLPSLMPLTPAPSLEVASLKTAAPERSWSSLLSAALSRMSSSSPAASADTPPAAPGQTLPAAAPAPAARQGRAMRQRLLPAARSRLGRCHAGHSSASGAAIDETAELPAPLSLQHTSSTAADGPADAGRGSNTRVWWPMSVLAWRAAGNGAGVPATPPPSAASSSASGEPESDAPAPPALGGRLAWPLLLLQRASAAHSTDVSNGVVHTPSAAVSAAVVPPADGSERRSSTAAHAQAFAAQPQAQGLFGVLRDAASGAGHVTSAAGHLVLAVDVLVVEPAWWLWSTLVMVTSSGARTAAWLMEWAWWWAVLPGRLAWWWAAAVMSVAARVCRLLAWPLTRPVDAAGSNGMA